MYFEKETEKCFLALWIKIVYEIKANSVGF